MRNLGLSLKIYVDENEGCMPPRAHPTGAQPNHPRWPHRLQPSYADLKILLCPSEVDDPVVNNPPTLALGTQYPADFAPRSFIYNSFNDWYLDYYTRKGLTGSALTNWRQNAKTDEVGVPESAVKDPSNTTVFGEKDRTSHHWYFDYETYEDITQLDQSKHNNMSRTGGGGGADYIFADGSARYMRSGATVSPLNMWAVLDSWRNIGMPTGGSGVSGE